MALAFAVATAFAMGLRLRQRCCSVNDGQQQHTRTSATGVDEPAAVRNAFSIAQRARIHSQIEQPRDVGIVGRRPFRVLLGATGSVATVKVRVVLPRTRTGEKIFAHL